MFTFNLSERKSFTYRDGWSSCDEWEFIGEVKATPMVEVGEPQGYDDGGTYLCRVIAPTHLRGRDLTRAIEHTMSHSGCKHEHDCCGCSSSYAEARRVSKREYVVRQRVSFNV